MVVVRLRSVVWPIAIGGKPPPTGVCGVRYVLVGRQSRARSDRFGLCRPDDADPVWEGDALCLGGQAIQGAEGQGSGYVDQTTQIQCGRGLAPDGGVSVDIIID